MADRTRKTAAKSPIQPVTSNEAAPRPPAGKIEITVNGVPLVVTPDLKAAVQRAIEGSLKPLPKEMTTTQAADYLDVSRPFVVKLVKRGLLPCRFVGKHRRIPSDALVKYRERMFQRAMQAADELVQESQALGLYDQ